MLKVIDFSYMQKENESRLYDFLEFAEHLLCKNIWLNKTHVFHDNDPNECHHQGNFLKLTAIGPKIDSFHFRKWIVDTEHGFLHGFLVAFLWYTLNTDKQNLHDLVNCTAGGNQEVSRLFYSFLFHDFVKSAFGQEPHDQLLEVYFPKCTTDTYCHANPVEETELVLCDRLELFRYEDCDAWMNKDLIDKYSKKYGKNMLNHFYRHLRPCLSKIMNGYDDVWLFHSSESNWCQLDENRLLKNANLPPKDLRQMVHEVYYPEHHWKFDESTSNYFSVAHGSLFNISSLWPSGANYFPSLGDRFFGITGCITKSSIERTGSEITTLPDDLRRDHFFVKYEKMTLIEDWAFLYKDESQLKEIKLENSSLLSENLAIRFCVVANKFMSAIKVLRETT